MSREYGLCGEVVSFVMQFENSSVLLSFFENKKKFNSGEAFDDEKNEIFDL